MQIRIKNFRSFKDTGFIDIKPITILIGKNSAGKSSFIRTFPMLKQSFEERTRSPILLYGNYVDFGTYKDIKPNFNTDTDLYELDFILNKDIFNEINRQRRFSRYSYGYIKPYSGESFFDIQFNVKFEEDKKNVLHISEINLGFLENKINISLNYSKKQVEHIIVNKTKIINIENNIKFTDRGDFLFDFYQADVKTEDRMGRKFSLEALVQNLIIKEISKYVHGRTEQYTKWKIVEGIQISNDEEILKQLTKKVPSSWYTNVSKWTVNNNQFRTIKDLIILYEVVNTYLSSINTYMKYLFLNINYIAPLRATAERYYRIQHLAVNEVDPNGKNLPFFLDSLTETQNEDFKNWTNENFGFKISISKSEGHYSIKIIHDEKYEINLSDMGFGYSQILPILTQLWYSSSKYSRHTNRVPYHRFVEKIIVIEQPELHLHPEFQAKFADVMTKVVKNAEKNKIKLRLIIETHSDIIINRLGDLILDDEINADEINIVIFNKETEDTPTNIEFAKYDNDGNLLNWPLGFFQASIRK